MKVHYKINGKDYSFEIHPGKVLLDVLRENGFTEIKGNCYMGTCGACTVIINGTPKTSCTVLAAQINDAEILTIKGIGSVLKPHPLQEAFIKKGAVQCGYCTPGTILSAYALLQKNPNPTDEEIKRAIDGNLCRCTGYVQQIEAIKFAIKLLTEEK